MTDPFELLAKGHIGELSVALEQDPALARARHESGASLFAWAHYVGQADAAEMLRPLFEPLDPHDVVIAGDEARVSDLIESGWNVEARAADGFTPLALAAFFVRPAVFERLLPLTRNLDAAAHNAQKVAAIHAATARRQAAMVEALLRAGASPDPPQAGGFTPLHVAAQHGDTAIAAMLVLSGADPRKTDDKGQDAIAHARAGGHDWLASRLAVHG